MYNVRPVRHAANLGGFGADHLLDVDRFHHLWNRRLLLRDGTLTARRHAAHHGYCGDCGGCRDCNVDNRVEYLCNPKFPHDTFRTWHGFRDVICDCVCYRFGIFLLPAREDSPEIPVKWDIVLLGRLPFDKRGALISLHAEDHYVRVETVKGSELILMRLADAIQLAQPIKGVQVHRSHWVALDQVTGYDKTDGTWTVLLCDGRRVPISRGYHADAITAGIIPARG